MSLFSAFGFSGFDPLGSLGEGLLNQHFARQQADYTSALNYKYAQQSALELPSLQRQGLERAGYNPLLAVMNGGVAAPMMGNGSSAMSHVTGSGTGGFDADAFGASKQSMRLHRALADTAVADAASAKAMSKADIASARLERELDDARLEALQSLDYDSDSKTRSEFKQAYRNAIERDRYVNSREHAVAEDAINAVHGGSSAFSNIAHGMRALRDRSRRRP